MSEPTVVTIRRSGNLIQVNPAHELLLGPELRYMHLNHEFKGYRQTTTPELRTLYTLDAGGCLITSAGMTERVCSILKRHGYTYEFFDLRQQADFTVDLTRLGPSRPSQDEALAAMMANDHGVIVAPTAYGKSHLIREMCSIYTRANIVVCTSRVSVLQSHYRRLLTVVPTHDLGIVGGDHNDPKRITISTSQSLMKAPIDKCDIFMFDEVHEAPAKETANMIARVPNARMFGFTASPIGRHDNAELVIEALFGKVIYNLPYQEAVKLGLVSQIYVRFNAVNGSALQLGPKPPRVTRYRKGIWYNAIRNRKIAEVARRYDKDTQVLIAVDTVQHAMALKRELPEFQVCYNEMSDKSMKALSGRGLLPEDFTPISMEERSRMQEMFEKRQIMKVIATSVWHVGVDFTTLNVLIRADGESGEIGNIQIPGRLSRTADGKEGGILEDFGDEFDTYFHRQSQSRKQSYKSRGWEITQDKPEGTYQKRLMT